MGVENHLLREARRYFRLAAERQTQLETAEASVRQLRREHEELMRKAREHQLAGETVK